MTRAPAVAGRFYPAAPVELRQLVDRCFQSAAEQPPRRSIGAIAPHAGLIYSGVCAATVFGRVSLPPTVVIIAPNHTGRSRSPGASIWRSGAFETPLGQVAIDETFAAALEEQCELVSHDPAAHEFEHAIEVELPFLIARSPTTEIVPLVLAWDDWPRSERLAATIAEMVAAAPYDVLLVASSDMTHYESAADAERKDRLAFEVIERLDGRALLEACHRERITMCGRAPAAVVLEAARRLGATTAELVDYRHSGLITGNHGDVVSYAGIGIS